MNPLPFLFLHGFLGSSTDWDPLISALPVKETLLLKPTLPGHNRSVLPKKNPLLPAILCWIENLLDKEGIDKVNLVGYSLGGRLALYFGKRFPNRINRLFLLSTHPGLEKGREERIAIDTRWGEILRKKGIDSFLQDWYAQPMFRYFTFDKKIQKRRRNHCVEDLAKILLHLSPARLPPLWNAIKQFPFPTFFLFGEFDIKYQKIHARLKAAKGIGETVEIKEAGHVLHLEKPQSTAHAIMRLSTLTFAPNCK